jgi:ubiquinone/menaquinone biosynthesis C-methylase UbiE
VNVLEELGRKFARLATTSVVRRPGLWRLFRAPLRRQFDALAARWEEIRAANPQHLAAFEAALETLAPAPRRALDLGTGTGAAAFAIAACFPEAEVVGADLAPAMIEEARRNTPPGLAERVRFEVADASRLPYSDRAFDLVALANMIPFFDELRRVVAPGGAVICSFSRGAATPIYVPFATLRRELVTRGFGDFTEYAVADATALLARKAEDR